MFNKSDLNVEFIDKNARCHMGGWSSYCEFYEITNDRGDCLALVNEQTGTIIFPHQTSGKRHFQRSYRNQVIPVRLLEVHDDCIIVKIFNKYNTINKLYYYPKKEEQFTRTILFSLKILLL